MSNGPNTFPVGYPDLGVAAFDQLDTWTQNFVFAGQDPAPGTFTGFAFEMNQNLPMHTPVGPNARGKLVPATVTSDVKNYFVTSATVAAGGTGGANGTQTVTGTTGTGTKFQASVTVAGGAITAVKSITLEGAYSVAPTTPATEPVTGASLTGAELNIVVESNDVVTEGVQAQFVTTQAVITPDGDDTVTAPVYWRGVFNIRALQWDASFTTDVQKFRAFNGAPNPSQIFVRSRNGDPATWTGGVALNGAAAG